MTTTVGCVILTMGDRAAALARAVASVRSQRDVDVDVLVVANGAELAAPPRGARLLALPTNVGIPAGRNRGLAEVGGDLVLFLDDDARLADEAILATVVGRFAADPALAVVSLRVTDPDGGADQRRHVPRLRAGDPGRSSRVTTFLGGASVVRRAAFEQAGGFPDRFRYAHEETSLAWRLIDAGYTIWYAGDLCVHHPAAPPARHAEYHYLTARNRVFLARRHLPLPLAVVYVLVWTVLTLLRSPGGRSQVARGLWAGLRGDAGRREPIRWRTVWTMTRAGRPPII